MMMSVDVVANEGDFFLKSSDWREYFSKRFEQKRKKNLKILYKKIQIIVFFVKSPNWHG